MFAYKLFLLAFITFSLYSKYDCQKYRESQGDKGAVEQGKGKGMSIPVNFPQKSEIVTKKLVDIVPLPSKQEDDKNEPVCVDPFMLGIPTIHNCNDLKIMGEMKSTMVQLQDGLENCQLMNDETCDNGSGEGFRAYQNRISSAGGLAVTTNPGVGPCLSGERLPDGHIYVTSSIDRKLPVLCCRSICPPPTTTTTSTTTTTTTSTTTTTTTTTTVAPPQEQLLPLEDIPPNVLTTLTPPSIPVYVTPSPIAQASADVSVSAEMCVLPQFLELPQVSSCEDLRRVSLSTDYLNLVNIRASDCLWEEDITCAASYPGLGSYMTSNNLDGACLAFRQTSCGNIVGTFPILQKHIKDVCSRHGHAKQEKGGQQMMMMMPVPMPANHKGKGRLLIAEDSTRKLHGKKGASPSKGQSDSIVLCCRLRCGSSRTVVNAAAHASGHSSVSYNNGNNVANVHQLIPESNYRPAINTQMGYNYQIPNNNVAPYNPQYPTNNGFPYNNQNMPPQNMYPPTSSIADQQERKFGNSPSPRITETRDLCNARYAQICTMATPLVGEIIVFDQRCLTENLIGCYAGGMQCCRSVNKNNFT